MNLKTFANIRLFVALFVVFKHGSAKRFYVPWEPYTEDGLPPMYSMEDFFECEIQQGTFCKVEALIKSIDSNSTLAKEIQKSNKISYRFSRSSVYRMTCVPQNISKHLEVKNYLENKLGNELKDYNVTLDRTDFTCNVSRQLNCYDYLILIFILAYMVLVCTATITYELKRRKEPNYPISKYDNWFMIFSIRKNREELNTPDTDPDLSKLKSIQGIRFFVTVMIIAFHTRTSFLYVFLDNPQDLEQTFSSKMLQFITQMDMFSLQIFFMISTFLLTNQIYEIHQKHGYFSLTHCFKLYFNQVLRYMPTLGITILLVFPMLKIWPQGTTTLDLLNMTWDNCGRSWWATILQLNIFYPFSKMCMQGTWWLSVETFLCSTTIVILYIQLKLNLDIRKILAMAFTGMTLIFASIINFGDHDIYKPYPENMKKMFSSSAFQTFYVSPLSNWSTGCVGICFGAMFFHTKNKKYNISPVFEKLWLSTFLVPPVLVVFVSSFEFDGFWKAVIGSLLKPAFVFSFGIGILGMSHGLGGIVKQTLESEYAVKMGKFTYCTYLYHFFLVFGRAGFNRSLVHYKSHTMVAHYFQNILWSFLCGIIATLILEYPWLRLQKMYIPQVKEYGHKKHHEVKNK